MIYYIKLNQMKAYIFIPDTDKKAGLGHLKRSINLSTYVPKKDKVFIFVKNSFSKTILNKMRIKDVKFLIYKKLNKKLFLTLKKKYELIAILDSYNKKLHNLTFENIFLKKISIIDFKIKNNSQINIDHTFGRKKNFHTIDKNQKIYLGHNFFPIRPIKKNREIKNIILINFGTSKNKIIFEKSLFFLRQLNIKKNLKIVLINQYLKKKDLKKYKKLMNFNEIIHIKHINNLDDIYKKTLFSIGACGISLYERSFFHIPSIAKSIAKNQNYNFSNFSQKKCILKFDKIINKKKINHKNRIKLLSMIAKTKIRLEKIFNHNNNSRNLRKLFKSL